MNNEKWEKEFDEKFGDNLSLDGPFDKSYAKLVLAPALKYFISQTLQAAVEERDTFWQKNEEKRVVRYEALGYHKGKIEERKRINEWLSGQKRQCSPCDFEDKENCMCDDTETFVYGWNKALEKFASIINKHQ